MGKVAKFLALLLLPFLVMVAAAPTPPPAVEESYPHSMADLGDSITQANNVCCSQDDHPEKSWATGDDTDDGMSSHYERLLQLAPGIRAHNFNYSVSGAKASDLPRQVSSAARQGAGYVTLLVGANDLCTPSVESMTSVEEFHSYVDQTLQTLEQMQPRPQVFVASIPDIYQLWNVLHADPAARSAWSDRGICPSMLSVTATEETRQQVVQRHLAFNAVLAEACAQHTNCRTDDYAVYNYQFSTTDVSRLDYFHPSLQGQAKLAEITWNAAW
ncbi:lysophospholipase L1-like esterase [Pseudarthrobacter sp. W1I19]|uniref:GDSL-type esterase/lipase family protein n=1 Tax=Pseudarthrobacter sp. W1I19 TaxID=3042288 RepID=UPI00277DFAD5|nr:GDSL-type esterase/lipase family protein [Pseudarthrobacter sp. W1I19]MDQ0925046.1 lysophospholipase L1-like esterase [Pseudarthrobacter sp. W1I19]